MKVALATKALVCVFGLTVCNLIAGDSVWVVQKNIYGSTTLTWNNTAVWKDGILPSAGDDIIMTNQMLSTFHQQLPTSAMTLGRFYGWPGVILEGLKNYSIADASEFEGSWWMNACNTLTLGTGVVASPVVGRLHTQGGPTLAVAAESATAAGVFGGGYLRKRGAGTLRLDNPSASVSVFVNEGGVELGATERGDAVDVAALLASATFHFDASVCDASTMSVVDGRVTEWKDLNSTRKAVPEFLAKGGTDKVLGPQWVANYQNGLGCLDFGPAAASAASALASGSSALRYDRQVNVTACFIVMADRDPSAATRVPVFCDADDARWERSASGGVMNDNFSMADGDLRVNGNRVDNLYQLAGTELKVISLRTPLMRCKDLGYRSDWLPVPMSAIAANCYSSFGGQRVGEVVLFNNVRISESQFAAIDAYLRKKWLSADKADRPDYDDVRLAANANVVTVAAGETVRVRRLTADDNLIVKTGTGTLDVDRVAGDVRIEVREGAVNLVGGAAIADDAPAKDPKFHFDAEDVESFEKEGSGITKWHDKRGTGFDCLVSESEIKNPQGSVTFATRLPTRVTGALNGHAVVDFGSRYPLNGLQDTYSSSILKNSSGARLASSLTANHGANVREGFYVAYQTEIHSYPLSSYFAYTFFHSDGGQLIAPTLAALPLRGAKWTLDGSPVDPANQAIGVGGYHLYRFAATGKKVQFDSVFRDRSNQNFGGGKIAEIILYDRELSDSERIDTEAYLLKKWFNKPHPSSVGQASIILGENANSEIQSEHDVAVKEIELPSQAFTKSGPGKLTVDSLSGATSINVSEGQLVVTPVSDLLKRAAFRVDPSVATSLTVETETGVSGLAANQHFVSEWRDANGGSMKAVRVPGNAFMPVLWESYAPANDRNVMYFGRRDVAATANATGISVHDARGRGMNWSSRLMNVKEGFLMFSDFPGAVAASQRPGFVLADTGAYNFHRKDDFHLWDTTYASAALRYGSRMTVDNALLDASAGNSYLPPTNASGEFGRTMQLLAFAITNGTQVAAGAFCNDRNLNYGGLVMGEYVIYTNSLTFAQHELVRDHLLRKWRNMNAGLGSYDSLAVGVGASLALPEANVSASALSFSFGSGGSSSLSVDGKFDLTVPGTITIDVAEKRIPDLVDWPLVTAARGIVGSLSGWTVVVSGVDSYTASLRVSPASESGEQTVLLSLTRNQPGLMVIVAGR